MHRITAFFSLLLMLCLTACMTAGNLKRENIQGLWKNAEGQFFLLEEGGALSLMRSGEAAGVSWSFDGTALTLLIQKSPDDDPEQKTLFLLKRGLFGLGFRDEHGNAVEWSRSYKKVDTLEGKLFYRERMMLPPDVLLQVQLLPLEGEAAVGQSMVHVDGRGELSFSVCYLEEDLDERARIDASIFYGGEPLFVTPESQVVELSGRASVLLHHAVPSQKKEVPLKGTYWRLAELGGILAESFADQPDPHLILGEKGEAAGSDGCNNFFMGWEAEEEHITFTPGGATLRLCPGGEEQARKMLQMFPSVKSWNIIGNKLELKSEDSVEAVFEAVEM